MKKGIYMLMAVVALLNVCQAKAQDMQRFIVNVGDFTHLLVEDHVNVVYECNPDSTGFARYYAKPELARQIVFTNNKKGKLSISIGSDSIYAHTVPTVVVYSAYLQTAENQGDSTLTVKSVATAPHIKFKLMNNGTLMVENVEATTVEAEVLTGKGRLEIHGKCNDFEAKNTGKADIYAEGLVAKNVSCRILGTGRVYCYINGGKLSLKGSGTGKVYYRGVPAEMKSFQLGSIKAISLDQTQPKNEEVK